MPSKRGPARTSNAIKRKHRFRKKHTHHVTPVRMKELLAEAKALLEEWLVNYDAVEVQVLADLISKLEVEVLPATTPVIYTKTMTLADTEYSQALPADVKKFTIHCRDGTTFRMAFEAGKVAAPAEPYWTVPTKGSEWEDLIEVPALTIYFACAQAAKIIEIIAWS